MPKSIRRKNKLHKLELGFDKYKRDVKRENPKANFFDYPLYQYIQRSKLKQKPKYSDTTKYFLKNKSFFRKENETIIENDILLVSKVSSIIDNYNETTLFFEGILGSLYQNPLEGIKIDSKDCIQMDTCASMCMDIILADFIKYHNQCRKDGHKMRIHSIKPINVNSHNIQKVLFSVGTYRNLKGLKIDFPNLKPFPIIIGDKNNPKLLEKREVDITKIIDYMVKCLGELRRTLTNKVESNLYKVIGEIVINTKEHSDKTKRYIIGYFEKIETSNEENYGILNLSILNFGKTLYETFKGSDNEEITEQMKSTSRRYATKGLSKKRKFEEETLWTLYALQDGVTNTKDWKRGNGTIRFIESFFDLKGNCSNDDISKMIITTGHTQTIFDGKYQITKRKRNNTIFKMMAFNHSENIEDIPDEKYVKYQENYFPGMIISVKLRLDYGNTIEIN